jgi:hypothetical protein
MDDPKPYYILLVIILIFIFMWFFIGSSEECEFVGLKPLSPDHIIEYGDSYYSPKKFKDEKYTIEEILSEHEENDNICVDTTPELPEEFTKQTVVPNNKFLSRGEKICKDTLEKIYGVPFKNTRPNWLRNDTTGRCLELDCYNEKLKIAVEYQGQSHYKYPNYFHKSYEEFKEAQRRDKLKSDLCKKQGVHLITVPYNINLELIPTYIMYHLPEIIQKRLKNDQVL